MEQKQEMEEIFNNLTEENKDILNMIAKGIEIGQQNPNKEV